MQDFQHMLLRDRKDIEIGKMDRGAFKKAQKKKKQYCSRSHVYFRLQVCDSYSVSERFQISLFAGITGPPSTIPSYEICS